MRLYAAVFYNQFRYLYSFLPFRLSFSLAHLTAKSFARSKVMTFHEWRENRRKWADAWKAVQEYHSHAKVGCR